MILSSSGAKQLFSVFLTVSWSVPTALLALLPGKAHSQQLDVVLDSNAINLVKSLVTTGSDLNPTSTRLIGDPSCSARFGNLRAVLDGDASMPDQGIILSSGSPESLVGGGMNTGGSVSTGFGRPGDSDLDALIDPVQTFDACFLEVEFESPPERDIVVSYVFASEEYLEWVGSGFVDTFAFFLNGQNIATVPGTVEPITINTINDSTNSEFFLSNTNGEFSFEADGFTTKLTARGQSDPSGKNVMKFGIADGGDNIFDAWVMLASLTFDAVPLGAPAPNPAPVPNFLEEVLFPDFPDLVDLSPGQPTSSPSVSSAPSSSSSPSESPSLSSSPSESPSLSSSCLKSTKTKSPGKGTKSFGKGTKSPGKGTKSFGKGTKSPGKGTKSPGKGIKSNGKGTCVDNNTTKSPGKGMMNRKI